MYPDWEGGDWLTTACYPTSSKFPFTVPGSLSEIYCSFVPVRTEFHASDLTENNISEGRLEDTEKSWNIIWFCAFLWTGNVIAPMNMSGYHSFDSLYFISVFAEIRRVSTSQRWIVLKNLERIEKLRESKNLSNPWTSIFATFRRIA